MAQSMAEPPPKAKIQSGPNARHCSSPFCTSAIDGFFGTPEYTTIWLLFFSNIPLTRSTTPVRIMELPPVTIMTFSKEYCSNASKDPRPVKIPFPLNTSLRISSPPLFQIMINRFLEQLRKQFKGVGYINTFCPFMGILSKAPKVYCRNCQFPDIL